MRTVLIGLGTVNIGLLKILLEKKEEVSKKHNLELTIVAVADSSGIAINDIGYSFEELISLKGLGDHVSKLAGYLPGETTESITNKVEAQLLIEGSPVDLETGNPGLSVIRSALKKGWSVVTANKAPLVLAFDELQDLITRYG